MCHTALQAARNHYGLCARYTLAPCTTAHYADFAFDIMTVATCAHAGNEEAKRFVEFLKSESDYYKKSATR